MIKLKPGKWNAAIKVVPKPVASTQDYLLEKGKMVGQIATKTFFEVKQFLQKDIPLPAPLRSQKESGIQQFKVLSNKKAAKSKSADDLKDKVAKLKKAVSQSHERLASGRTVFPFTLFPDDVVVDRTKVTIIKRDFFLSANVISIRIEDVLNVSAGTGPFFGSLNIASRVMNSTDHFTINYLPKKDAIHLKHIIQGYVIAQHNNIDTSHLSKDELIETLCELGDDTSS